MSALSMTRRRFPVWLAALGVVLWTCAVNLINESLPISAPNDHAVERHGQDAWIAIDWLEAHPQTRKRLDCPGRNTIWHDVLPDGREAVVVTTEGDWETARNITAMLLSQSHYQRFVRNCGGALLMVTPTRRPK